MSTAIVCVLANDIRAFRFVLEIAQISASFFWRFAHREPLLLYDIALENCELGIIGSITFTVLAPHIG